MKTTTAEGTLKSIRTILDPCHMLPETSMIGLLKATVKVEHEALASLASIASALDDAELLGNGTAEETVRDLVGVANDLAEDNKRTNDRIAKLEIWLASLLGRSRALYKAGTWKLPEGMETEDHQAKLWEQLRDAIKGAEGALK